MRIRTFHTPINLLVEPTLYQRLKMTAKLEKTPMSQIIREGIKLRLDEIDKKNYAVMQGGQE
jgi:predicted DNA-binding protein